MKKITSCIKSCLTGKVVWIGKSPTPVATKTAYMRACRREQSRMRCWLGTIASRKTNIMRFLDQLLPHGDIPTSAQAAAQSIVKIANTETPCDTEFYNHIVAERRKKLNGGYV